MQVVNVEKNCAAAVEWHRRLSRTGCWRRRTSSSGGELCFLIAAGGYTFKEVDWFFLAIDLEEKVLALEIINHSSLRIENHYIGLHQISEDSDDIALILGGGSWGLC